MNGSEVENVGHWSGRPEALCFDVYYANRRIILEKLINSEQMVITDGPLPRKERAVSIITPTYYGSWGSSRRRLYFPIIFSSFSHLCIGRVTVFVDLIRFDWTLLLLPPLLLLLPSRPYQITRLRPNPFVSFAYMTLSQYSYPLSSWRLYRQSPSSFTYSLSCLHFPFQAAIKWLDMG